MREVAINADAVDVITATLTAAGVPFRLAKTWTTDAVYRETADRVAAASSRMAANIARPRSAPAIFGP